MKKYIKQRIMSIERGLSLAQKRHVISSIYDRLEERDHKCNYTGAVIAELIMERIRELHFLLELNEREFNNRKPKN